MWPRLLLPHWRSGRRLATHRLAFLASRRLRLNLDVTTPGRIRYLHRSLPRSGLDHGVSNGRLVTWWLRKQQQTNDDPNQQATKSPNLFFHVLSPDFPNNPDSYLSLLYTIPRETHLKVSTRCWLPVMIAPLSAKMSKLATAATMNSKVYDE